MPSQAEQYFNSLTPQQQEAARATGAAPGGPNFDQWFANAQASGAVGRPNQAGGGGVGTPQGQTGGGGSGVTPNMVRENAQKLGLPEDHARFSDAQLQDWISRWPYNPATGKFTNKYGDQVDKPDERGPNTPRNMNGTGDRGDYGFGANDSSIGGPGDFQGGGRARGGGASGRRDASGNLIDDSYLQNKLLETFERGGGFYGDQGGGPAQRLDQGGVWWADPAKAGAVDPLDPAATGGAPPAAPPAPTPATTLAGAMAKTPMFGGTQTTTAAPATAPGGGGLFKDTLNTSVPNPLGGLVGTSPAGGNIKPALGTAGPAAGLASGVNRAMPWWKKPGP